MNLIASLARERARPRLGPAVGLSGANELRHLRADNRTQVLQFIDARQVLIALTCTPSSPMSMAFAGRKRVTRPMHIARCAECLSHSLTDETSAAALVRRAPPPVVADTHVDGGRRMRLASAAFQAGTTRPGVATSCLTRSAPLTIACSFALAAGLE